MKHIVCSRGAVKVYLNNLNENWVVDRFRNDWILKILIYIQKKLKTAKSSG